MRSDVPESQTEELQYNEFWRYNFVELVYVIISTLKSWDWHFHSLSISHHLKFTGLRFATYFTAHDMFYWNNLFIQATS